MTEPNYIRLECTDSTNAYLSRIADTMPHGTVVETWEQSAGRGQRGNSWEAEPGKNLTFSILLRPAHIGARQQFSISEAVSIAIVEVLRRHIANLPVEVKWPNDIYVGSRKICGILIENSLMGTGIAHSIVGIGINVNQKHFLSDAPNPVSLISLTGQESNLDALLDELCRHILETVDTQCRPSMQHTLHRNYISMMWHRNGYHPYIDVATGKAFRAIIANVNPDGMLILVDSDGKHRQYAFKEVSAVID